MKTEKFAEFYRNHVRKTQYTFQVKKCADLNCPYHGWVRLDLQTFENVHWLPSPQLASTDSDKFKTFEETYGTEPTDDARPGRSHLTHHKQEKAEFQLAPQRARMIVCYSECNFPRLLYSKTKLAVDEMKQIREHFEDDPFICGHELGIGALVTQKVFQHPKSYCYRPVSPHYYQCSSLTGFNLVCSVCLNPDINK